MFRVPFGRLSWLLLVSGSLMLIGSLAEENFKDFVEAAHRKMSAMLFNRDLKNLLHEWKVSQLLRELGNDFEDEKLSDVKTLINLEKLDKSKCRQEKVYHEQLDKYPKDVPLHKYLKYVDNRMHEYCHTPHRRSSPRTTFRPLNKTTTTTAGPTTVEPTGGG